MGGYSAGLGSGGANTGGASNLPLIPGSYDQFELERDPITKDVIQVDCFRDTVLLLRLSLAYDIDGDLISVIEVPVG